MYNRKIVQRKIHATVDTWLSDPQLSRALIIQSLNLTTYEHKDIVALYKWEE